MFNLQFISIQTITKTHEIKQLLPYCAVNQSNPNEHWLQSHHSGLTEEYSPLFSHWRWQCCRLCCTWWVTLPPVSACRSRSRWKKPGPLRPLPWSSLPVYPASGGRRQTDDKGHSTTKTSSTYVFSGQQVKEVQVKYCFHCLITFVQCSSLVRTCLCGNQNIRKT